MKLAYYPGCSLESSSQAYDLSVRQVCDAFAWQLDEIDDWNCCGATEVASLDKLVAGALIARNLARVGEGHTQVVAPCAACFLNLKKTDRLMCDHKHYAKAVNDALDAGGLSYTPGSLDLRHLVDVLYKDAGEERFKAKVTRPLNGLRVAPYYGCQIARPDGVLDDPEHPKMMDHLLRWAGAKVVDFPLRTACCGGHMTQISDDMSNELIRRLLHNAEEWDADVIAVACPMCQLNLDAYQGRVNNAFNTKFKIPILFFTQLIGLSFGIDHDALGFGREIVDAEAVLAACAAAGEAPATAKIKRSKSALPMPGSR